MIERFAKTKLLLTVVTVMISLGSATVALLAWQSSADTQRKQLQLSTEFYTQSGPILSSSGGLDIESSGKTIYNWFGRDSKPAPIALATWKTKTFFVFARVQNTGGRAARLANYGLAYSDDSWIPADSKDAYCKPQAFVPWKGCDPTGDLIQPGQILFFGFNLTADMIAAVPDSFRQHITLSYEAGAYNVKDVVIPIPIPSQAQLGY